eukprot:gene12960-42146_t
MLPHSPRGSVGHDCVGAEWDDDEVAGRPPPPDDGFSQVVSP